MRKEEIKKDLIEKLETFRKASRDLCIAIEIFNGEMFDNGFDDDVTDYIVNDYPFEESFDEIEEHISNWVFNSIEHLEHKENK